MNRDKRRLVTTNLRAATTTTTVTMPIIFASAVPNYMDIADKSAHFLVVIIYQV